MASFIKSHITIEITRSADDNGNNGQYYKSTLNIKFMGISLNSISIQSTADHPRLDAAANDKTLSTGDYTGYLLSGSGSYNTPIQLVNDSLGATINDNFMIHPDQFTKKTGGPWSQPFSKGCQITRLDDFNEMTGILQGIGFKYGGQLNDRNPLGDSIKVRIK